MAANRGGGVIVVLTVTLGCGRSPGPSGDFIPVVVDHPRFGGRAYSVFVPPPPIPDQPLPLVVFLHGSGEVGRDGWKHLKVGLAPYCRQMRTGAAVPRFYALFPQAGDTADWSLGSDEAELVLEYVDHVCARYPIDRSRIYLVGQSAGGTGAWCLAASRPDLWAALVVVSGEGDPAIAPRVKHLPTWVFHGAADEPGSVRNARAMVAALRTAGGDARYTELSGGTHIIWPDVFFRPDLYDWLLAQRRPNLPNSAIP